MGEIAAVLRACVEGLLAGAWESCNRSWVRLDLKAFTDFRRWDSGKVVNGLLYTRTYWQEN